MKFGMLVLEKMQARSDKGGALSRALSVLKWPLFVLCLYYLFSEVGGDQLVKVVSGYRVQDLLFVLFVSLFQYVSGALRLNYLTKYRAGFLVSFNATMLALGLNNVLPGRAGELAKMVHIKSSKGIGLSSGAGAVFWERFFDVNILVLGSSFGLFKTDNPYWMLPILGFMLAVWGGLFLLNRPVCRKKILQLVPARFRLKCDEFIVGTVQSFKFRELFQLSLYTVLYWAAIFVFVYAIFNGLTDLNLSLQAVITILIVSSFAFALPGLPGGVGVMEASVVMTAGWFNVPQPDALGAALMLRFIQLVPTVLYATVLMGVFRRRGR